MFFLRLLCCFQNRFLGDTKVITLTSTRRTHLRLLNGNVLSVSTVSSHVHYPYKNRSASASEKPLLVLPRRKSKKLQLVHCPPNVN